MDSCPVTDFEAMDSCSAEDLENNRFIFSNRF
jgi:hypothetical protein